MTSYTAADEWIRNSSRRRKLSAIVLAPGPDGNPPDCALCSQPGADSVEHVLPRSKYPELTWELGNMVPAHVSCNASKGNRANSRDLGSLSRRW